MAASWKTSLYIKQALATLVLAVILSLLLSGLKAYDTLRTEPERIQSEFEQVLSLVEEPLAQALFRYDPGSAQQQAQGLLYHPAIEQVIILDETQTVFAQAHAETAAPVVGVAWLSNFLPSSLVVARDLHYEHMDVTLGRVILSLDRAYLAEQVIEANGQLLVQNLVKDMLLASLLSWLFYWLVTRPVKQLTWALGKIDSTHNAAMPNTFQRMHRNDELGHLDMAFRQLWERLSRALTDLDYSHQHAKAIINHAADGILVINEQHTITVANEAASQLLALPLESLAGQPLAILNMVNSERDIALLLSELAPESVMALETCFVHEQGQTPVEIRATKYCINDEFETVLLIRDLSESQAAQQQINRLSYYDPLTHLTNRTWLTIQLNKSMKSLAPGQNGALIIMDLDRFKTINDALGHDLGDQLLVHLADDLLPFMPPNVTFARIGGDEFAFLWDPIRGEASESNVTLNSFMQRVLYECSKVKVIQGHDLHTTASMGVSFYDGGEVAADTVLRQADTALYQAKENGRNTFVFFQESMLQLSSARLQIERALHRGLKENEFEVYYQPQVDVTGQLIGAEALLRWHSKELGSVPPSEFIPIAEDTGLIHEIGKWVLHQAMSDVARWRSEGLWRERWRISINVSPVQFSLFNLVEDIETALHETGLPAELVDIEITENMLMNNVERAIEKMSSIRRLGASLSVDDFGTGYSSLRYLKDLPIDRLKIDQSFARDLTADVNNEAIVRAVIAMGDALKLSVLAEGVETQIDFNCLEAMGCYTYQGYYFSRPISARQFRDYCVKQLRVKEN